MEDIYRLTEIQASLERKVDEEKEKRLKLLYDILQFISDTNDHHIFNTALKELNDSNITKKIKLNLRKTPSNEISGPAVIQEKDELTIHEITEFSFLLMSQLTAHNEESIPDAFLDEIHKKSLTSLKLRHEISVLESAIRKSITPDTQLAASPQQLTLLNQLRKKSVDLQQLNIDIDALTTQGRLGFDVILQHIEVINSLLKPFERYLLDSSNRTIFRSHTVPWKKFQQLQQRMHLGHIKAKFIKACQNMSDTIISIEKFSYDHTLASTLLETMRNKIYGQALEKKEINLKDLFRHITSHFKLDKNAVLKTIEDFLSKINYKILILISEIKKIESIFNKIAVHYNHHQNELPEQEFNFNFLLSLLEFSQKIFFDVSLAQSIQPKMIDKLGLPGAFQYDRTSFALYNKILTLILKKHSRQLNISITNQTTTLCDNFGIWLKQKSNPSWEKLAQLTHEALEFAHTELASTHEWLKRIGFDDEEVLLLTRVSVSRENGNLIFSSSNTHNGLIEKELIVAGSSYFEVSPEVMLVLHWCQSARQCRKEIQLNLANVHSRISRTLHDELTKRCTQFLKDWNKLFKEANTLELGEAAVYIGRLIENYNFLSSHSFVPYLKKFSEEQIKFFGRSFNQLDAMFRFIETYNIGWLSLKCDPFWEINELTRDNFLKIYRSFDKSNTAYTKIKSARDQPEQEQLNIILEFYLKSIFIVKFITKLISSKKIPQIKKIISINDFISFKLDTPIESLSAFCEEKNQVLIEAFKMLTTNAPIQNATLHYAEIPKQEYPRAPASSKLNESTDDKSLASLLNSHQSAQGIQQGISKALKLEIEGEEDLRRFFAELVQNDSSYLPELLKLLPVFKTRQTDDTSDINDYDKLIKIFGLVFAAFFHQNASDCVKKFNRILNQAHSNSDLSNQLVNQTLEILSPYERLDFIKALYLKYQQADTNFTWTIRFPRDFNEWVLIREIFHIDYLLSAPLVDIYSFITERTAAKNTEKEKIDLISSWLNRICLIWEDNIHKNDVLAAILSYRNIGATNLANQLQIYLLEKIIMGLVDFSADTQDYLIKLLHAIPKFDALLASSKKSGLLNIFEKDFPFSLFADYIFYISDSNIDQKIRESFIDRLLSQENPENLIKDILPETANKIIPLVSRQKNTDTAKLIEFVKKNSIRVSRHDADGNRVNHLLKAFDLITGNILSPSSISNILNILLSEEEIPLQKGILVDMLLAVFCKKRLIADELIIRVSDLPKDQVKKISFVAGFLQVILERLLLSSYSDKHEKAEVINLLKGAKSSLVNSPTDFNDFEHLVSYAFSHEEIAISGLKNLFIFFDFPKGRKEEFFSFLLERFARPLKSSIIIKAYLESSNYTIDINTLLNVIKITRSYFFELNHLHLTQRQRYQLLQERDDFLSNDEIAIGNFLVFIILEFPKIKKTGDNKLLHGKLLCELSKYRIPYDLFLETLIGLNRRTRIKVEKVDSGLVLKNLEAWLSNLHPDLSLNQIFRLFKKIFKLIEAHENLFEPVACRQIYESLSKSATFYQNQSIGNSGFFSCRKPQDPFADLIQQMLAKASDTSQDIAMALQN